MKNYPPATLAWTIWGLGAALYFIGFYQRVAPAVITNELSTAFQLTAASLGNLSAFYFYSYVAMQIPTGILADRLGPRKLLTAGACVAALGTAVFAMAPSVAWANAGRLFIGASVGVAFVAMLKLASVWMPARHFALSSGIAMGVGVFGAVAAGAPLRVLVDMFGWREVMWLSAFLTFAVAIATWFVVRDQPMARGFQSYAPSAETPTASEANSREPHDKPHAWQDLKTALRVPTVVLLFFIPGAVSATVLTFAGLWGVPFLVTHYQQSATAAATLCSSMMIAWAVGSIAFSAVSDRIGRRKPLFIGGLTLAMLCWAAIIGVRQWPIPGLTALLVATGFFCGCFILSFAMAKESGPARLAGTVSGISNMGVIQGPMWMQPIVGLILDHRWTGALVDGKRVFDFASYQQGFALILLWGVISLVLLCFTKETYCRQAH